MADGDSTPRTTIRRVAMAALALAAVAVVVLLSRGGGGGHEVVLLADEARYLNEGAQVRLAGRPVGQVADARPTREGKARLVLRIDDENAWPLRQGTRADLRWPGTIAFSNRYVSLVTPKQANRPPLAKGATIPASAVTAAVEIDQIAGTFDAGTRRDLKGTVDAAGAALKPGGPALSDALEAAPPAVDQADAVFADLGADPRRLGTLVASTDKVVHAIRVSDPGVQQLIGNAATTFQAINGRATQLQQLLERLPATMDDARGTLARADATLRRVDGVTDRLRPGVTEVRRLVRPLNETLATLRQVGPDARGTLASLRRATPDLNPLLDKATTLMPRVESIGKQLETQLDCVRPYSPEIGNFGTMWTAFNNTGDSQDKFFRSNAALYPIPAGTPLNAKQITDAYPSLHYAFPRPPGANAGQPWFQPQCKLGPETLDPAQDPEAKR